MQENLIGKSTGLQVDETGRSDALHYWPGRTWPLPATAATSQATEHALQLCRSLFSANQAAADAFYDTARRQQELTFKLARTALDAFSPAANGSAEERGLPWSRVMAGYVEAYHAGLDVSRTVAGATFQAMQRTPAKLTGGRVDGAAAS
ncbi:hypothetical protein [Roseomonas populi]|uniref:Phasin domain-containing protein n=1 Tax=Roseomonas populi TaxID=3121582 RepID=A0ABT1X0J7_9PROT|nr:hypothetical protein [Roseomonas pecuniae]MCR0981627.1 hypothetical protein [Roseomonas pecuniae]